MFGLSCRLSLDVQVVPMLMQHPPTSRIADTCLLRLQLPCGPSCFKQAVFGMAKPRSWNTRPFNDHAHGTRVPTKTSSISRHLRDCSRCTRKILSNLQHASPPQNCATHHFMNVSTPQAVASFRQLSICIGVFRQGYGKQAHAPSAY